MDTPRFGLSLRDEHVVDLIRDPTGVEALEVVAEHWMAHPHLARAQSHTLRHVGPITAHAIGLSLGSTTPPPRALLKDLAAVVALTGTAELTDHACITRSAVGEIGHLTPVLPGPDAARTMVMNLKHVRDALGVALSMENIAALIRLPGPWTPWEFLAHVAEEADVGILLDVENLHADALNFGDAPEAILRALPLHRVTHIHLAGGQNVGNRYVDTHGRAVPPATLEILTLATRLGARPRTVILERDNHIPPLAELVTELDAARDAWARGLAAAP
jgi:uncharacterized protein (UPF0276 family)